jgi:asparagine synthase (glutamine-hydrolysing)
MCGISGIAGQGWERAQLAAMVACQHHRGPDDRGIYIDPSGKIGLGHNRLSIIDLSPSGHQPMSNQDGTLWLSFNGEMYNYLELRSELSDYPYRTQTDTEVILAAYEHWGEKCLDHLLGMFAFLLWDGRTQHLFAARDRFGVKPLYYHIRADGTLSVASEIKALHVAGVPAAADVAIWATYLTYGLYDHSERTFWRDIQSLPAGHAMTWQDGRLHVWCWYDLAERIGPEIDRRPDHVVEEEYLALLAESVRLRFRADVPVGINLSGGLDSSILLGLVQAIPETESDVKAFTFVTGDPRYDELPWVQQMLARTRHPLVICQLSPKDVPALASSVQLNQDEPFGALPTLAYAHLFEKARQDGVIVLLDGQGMDEQWAGYDYYRHCLSIGDTRDQTVIGPVQGSRDQPVRPDCLTPDFRRHAEPLKEPILFCDSLQRRQLLDTRYIKIPRALRFNDRISMRSSTELREPFLDHRLFELALRQPQERKIVSGTHKKLLRQMSCHLLAAGVVEAPKRPLQTPQREWLRGELKEWADACIQSALAAYADAWLDRRTVQDAWQAHCAGASDNSFYVWQWINLALWEDCCLPPSNRFSSSPAAR